MGDSGGRWGGKGGRGKGGGFRGWGRGGGGKKGRWSDGGDDDDHDGRGESSAPPPPRRIYQPKSSPPKPAAWQDEKSAAISPANFADFKQIAWEICNGPHQPFDYVIVVDKDLSKVTEIWDVVEDTVMTETKNNPTKKEISGRSSDKAAKHCFKMAVQHVSRKKCYFSRSDEKLYRMYYEKAHVAHTSDVTITTKVTDIQLLYVEKQKNEKTAVEKVETKNRLTLVRIRVKGDTFDKSKDGKGKFDAEYELP
jgi:hypothetical protein